MIETPQVVETPAQRVASRHELTAWIEANGYETAGDLYECYVVGPESTPDPANWRTELSRPVIE